MPVFNNINISDVSTLNDVEKNLEFNSLASSINLLQPEDYDCKTLNIWSYRKGTDFRDGINLRFGNMCNGFLFEIAGVSFYNSECAYIAGAYGSNDPDSKRIQQEISTLSNGYLCKRIFRSRDENTQYIRKDWNDYNVQWMLYVVWQKCIINKDFSFLMKQIPIDGHTVENTTGMNGTTSGFWGAKNNALMDARKEAIARVSNNNSFRYQKELAKVQMLAANRINNGGHFVGMNVMGKIIKLCSLGLHYSQEPPIDYNLLLNKKLYLLGKLLDFQR